MYVGGLRYGEWLGGIRLHCEFALRPLASGGAETSRKSPPHGRGPTITPMADHGSQRGAGARADKPRPIWLREFSLAGGAWGPGWGGEESRGRHCARAQRVLVCFGEFFLGSWLYAGLNYGLNLASLACPDWRPAAVAAQLILA